MIHVLPCLTFKFLIDGRACKQIIVSCSGCEAARSPPPPPSPSRYIREEISLQQQQKLKHRHAYAQAQIKPPKVLERGFHARRCLKRASGLLHDLFSSLQLFDSVPLHTKNSIYTHAHKHVRWSDLHSTEALGAQVALTFRRDVTPLPLKQVNDHLLAVTVGVQVLAHRHR